MIKSLFHSQSEDKDAHRDMQRNAENDARRREAGDEGYRIGMAASGGNSGISQDLITSSQPRQEKDSAGMADWGGESEEQLMDEVGEIAGALSCNEDRKENESKPMMRDEKEIGFFEARCDLATEDIEWELPQATMDAYRHFGDDEEYFQEREEHHAMNRRHSSSK